MKNNVSSIIIVLGVLILGVFTGVAVYNFIPKNSESNSYYVKVEDDMSAKIEGLEVNKGILNIDVSGDAKEYCVKSTRSTPSLNALCWQKIENNKASISVYQYKKYYIWIKDVNDKISTPMSINTKENK